MKQELWARRARAIGAGCLLIAAACSAPAARDAADANDPFALVRSADALARQGDDDEATQRYLLALDEGRSRDSAFGAARGEVVRKLAALGKRYPPASEALVARSQALARRISLAVRPGTDVDGMDVKLFVDIARSTGNEREVQSTYALLKARLPENNRIRIWLGGEVERYLVQERRYAEALAEVGTEIVDYYLALFRSMRDDETVKAAVGFTIKNECGDHYEALLGDGRYAEADAFAERLIAYAPTARTLAVLSERAERAGAREVASRLRARASSGGRTSP